MLDKLHDHIMKELTQNRQIDTIFFLLSIVFNLMMLAINSAAQSSKDYSLIIVFFFLGSAVTLISIIILLKGKDTRKKLVNGLLMMYDDNNVSKYYDRTIIKNDNLRNLLQILVIVLTFLTSIVIPLLLKFIYKSEI